MLGGRMGSFRELCTVEDDGAYGHFEAAVQRQLGDKIRADIAIGVLLWCALANVDWTHPIHGDIGYSFRAAGDLIAALRREGDYIDWYCCGEYGHVHDVISAAMEREGWGWTAV